MMTVPTLCMVSFLFLVRVLVLKAENNDLKEEVETLESRADHHAPADAVGIVSNADFRGHGGANEHKRQAMHIIRNK